MSAWWGILMFGMGARAVEPSVRLPEPHVAVECAVLLEHARSPRARVVGGEELDRLLNDLTSRSLRAIHVARAKRETPETQRQIDESMRPSAITGGHRPFDPAVKDHNYPRALTLAALHGRLATLREVSSREDRGFLTAYLVSGRANVASHLEQLREHRLMLDDATVTAEEREVVRTIRGGEWTYNLPRLLTLGTATSASIATLFYGGFTGSAVSFTVGLSGSLTLVWPLSWSIAPYIIPRKFVISIIEDGMQQKARTSYLGPHTFSTRDYEFVLGEALRRNPDGHTLFGHQAETAQLHEEMWHQLLRMRGGGELDRRILSATRTQLREEFLRNGKALEWEVVPVGIDRLYFEDDAGEAHLLTLMYASHGVARLGPPPTSRRPKLLKESRSVADWLPGFAGAPARFEGSR